MPDEQQVVAADLLRPAPRRARSSPNGRLQRVARHRRGQEVHRRRADEPGDEEVDRLLVELARRRDLLEDALAQHADPVAEGHGLGLVVGDVDRRDAEPALQARDLGAHLPAQLGVEVRQRLVEQERVGLRGRSRGPSPRAGAGHRRGSPACARGARCSSSMSAASLTRRWTSSSGDLGQAQRERDVLEDGQVRVERVVLEHHRQVAVARRLVVDPLAADEHVAGGDVLQPDDHPQQRRLPAAGRPDEDHELAVGDVEADVVHGGEAVAVLLDDVASSRSRPCGALLGSASALDGAVGQAGDDPSLEQQDEDDDRDGDDDRGGRDGAGRAARTARRR